MYKTKLTLTLLFASLTAVSISHATEVTEPFQENFERLEQLNEIKEVSEDLELAEKQRSRYEASVVVSSSDVWLGSRVDTSASARVSARYIDQKGPSVSTRVRTLGEGYHGRVRLHLPFTHNEQKDRYRLTTGYQYRSADVDEDLNSQSSLFAGLRWQRSIGDFHLFADTRFGTEQFQRNHLGGGYQLTDTLSAQAALGQAKSNLTGGDSYVYHYGQIEYQREPYLVRLKVDYTGDNRISPDTTNAQVQLGYYF